MMSRSRTNRREFLTRVAVGGAGLAAVAAGAGCARVERKPLVKMRTVSPNEKLGIACIGCGGKGEGEVQDAAKEKLIALCDVDSKRARKMFDEYADVPKFKDYREMLEKHDKDIDAVTVSTPDHIHAPAALMAMRMGKHAFVQKPLARSVYECRRLAEVAREMKVATQMGNQGTSTSGLRRAVELLHAGVLGPVKMMHAWTNRPIWPQGQSALDGREKQAKEPQPETLDWKLWLGPAPNRPFNACYLPFNWRGWYDWGTGALGDMACHTLNMPYWGLKLCQPLSIEGKVSKLMDDAFPSGSVVKYEFPARQGMPAMTMIWYDGDMKPKAADVGLPEGEKLAGSGVLIVGEKGMMYSDGDYGDKWHLTPKSFADSAQLPESKMPRSPGHFEEWVRACKGGEPAKSNFPDYSGLLAEIVVLGCVAQRIPGRKLEWNPKTMKFKGCPEADPFVHPRFPRGYEV